MLKFACIFWIELLPAVNVDVWMCEQQLDDVDVPFLGREVERGPAVLPLDIHLHSKHGVISLGIFISPSLSLYVLISISLLGREVERGPAGGARGIVEIQL